jgi:hypothetical protein
VHHTGGTVIDYETHLLFIKLFALILLTGFLLLLLGEGWMPLVGCVLAVLVISACFGRMRRW